MNFAVAALVLLALVGWVLAIILACEVTRSEWRSSRASTTTAQLQGGPLDGHRVPVASTGRVLRFSTPASPYVVYRRVEPTPFSYAAQESRSESMRSNT